MKSNTEGVLRLVEQDFIDAGQDLGVHVSRIKAVDQVESSGGGFLPSGEVKILFEPHIFSRRTNHRFDASHPLISYPKWGTRKYGPVSAQHGRLQEALRLDERAALESASWGRFQVMGFNARLCGYDDVFKFVEAMKLDETNHLQAFLGYVKQAMLVDELQRLDWAGFAKGYNGPQYQKNDYAGKLRRAWLKFGGQ